MLTYLVIKKIILIKKIKFNIIKNFNESIIYKKIIIKKIFFKQYIIKKKI